MHPAVTVRLHLLLAFALLLFASAGSAAPDTTGRFDRTFSCAAGFLGGLHQVDLDVAFEAQQGSSGLAPSGGVTRNMFEAALGYVTLDGVTVHRGLCSPATRSLRLTTKGMRGGAAPALGAEARCETPRRFLLRIRAGFDAPPNAETSRQFGFPQLIVHGDVTHAAIAVGTPAGRPIAYLSIARGKARLFTVRSCRDD